MQARFLPLRSGLAAGLLVMALIVLLFPLSACAASRKTPEIQTHEGGSFPAEGRVTIRSGLSWLNEAAPVFAPLGKELAAQLKAKGMIVVEVPTTVSEPMPVTELPANADALSSPAPRMAKGAAPASGASTRDRAAELAREGKLPQLKLREYATPHKDADLPQSVRSIAPPDAQRALFALSQQKGVPIVRTLAVIPGRAPPELTHDAAVADYALVVRFALMEPYVVSSLEQGIAGAAMGFGGSGALGFGPPSSPGASAPPGGYGTPGGYVRGYENPSGPSDPWGRDHDFYQRDYMMKNSPPPPVAEPPSGLSGPMDGVPGGGLPPSERGRGGGYVTTGRETWHLLQIECYDLASAKNGKKPVIVWRAYAQQLAGEKPLASALPELAKAIFAAR